jgi:5-methylcytosine-specific restriction endonuclease McrA
MCIEGVPLPIKDRSRYPKDWPQIRARVLERAENKCEQCKAPNRETVMRFINYPGWYATLEGQVFGPDGEEKGWVRGSESPDYYPVRIVITIAHLDHDPSSLDEDRMRAWCQRCHLKHDQKLHIENAKATRRDKNDAKRSLFDGMDP